MVNKATTLEINGRLYDANTGKPVVAPARKNPKPSAQARMIDGFHAPAGARVRRPARNSQTVHQQAQRSQKLHPAAVKKQPQKQIHSTAAKRSAGPQQKAVPQRSLQQNPERMQRSARHKRSQHISKFGASQPEPQPQPQQSVVQQPSKEVFVPPPFKATTHQSGRHGQQDQQPADVPAQKDKPAKKANPIRRKFNEIRQAKPKLLPALTAVLAVLVLGGYFTYLNIPNMAMRVAASKAGFDGSLPGYRPSGFSFDGPIAYSPGHITISYSSNSDERNFKVVEKQSQWDSQSLLDNYLLKENKQYTTFQERGLTVYIYGDDDATWVDGGVWYTIDSNAQLNNEQLLKIAGSL